MLPLLSQSLCSKSLLPHLGTAVRILGNVQFPWDPVKQMHTQQQVCCVTVQQQHCSNPHLASSNLQQCRQLLSQPTHLPVAVRGVTTSTAACDTKLSDIMKLDRLQNETADAVEEIWLEVSSCSTLQHQRSQAHADVACAAV